MVTTSQTGLTAEGEAGSIIHVCFITIYRRLHINTPRNAIFGGSAPSLLPSPHSEAGAGIIPRDACDHTSYKFSARHWIFEKWCSWTLLPNWESCFTLTFLCVFFTLLPKPKPPPHQLLQVFPHPGWRDDSTQEIPRLAVSCFLPGQVVAGQGFTCLISFGNCAPVSCACPWLGPGSLWLCLFWRDAGNGTIPGCSAVWGRAGTSQWE